MILIAYSKSDLAGTNIANQALNNYPFRKTETTFQENPVYSTEINGKQGQLATLTEETVYAQDLPNHFPNPELIVFLSRHSSQSGKPTLSVHTPGNFGDAELGGLPRTLSIAAATAMRNALKSLNQLKNEMHLDYEVTYECTHHGPSLNVPTMFVELGSSPLQWKDSKAARAVAEAAMHAVANFEVSSQTTAAIGIGGPHYNPKFTEMALNDQALFGHMVPKYAIQNLDVETFSQAIERTLEKVTCAILDWKGIPSQDKMKVLRILAEQEMPYQKA